MMDPVIIEEADGYRLEVAERGIDLVVTGPWSDDAARCLAEGRADGLYLNYAKGFKDTDLAFISAWPIRRLKIIALTATNLDPLLALADTLDSLSINSAGFREVDLAQFPYLTHLGATWAQVRSSIDALPGLQDLYLEGFSEHDLMPLRWNSDLRCLRMKDRPRLTSLNGLEIFGKLEYLGVYLAPLIDLSALLEVGSQLTKLDLPSCPIRNLDCVGAATSLRALNVSDCREIDSLDPIRNLVNLETALMYGTTKIMDGDLTPLTELPNLVSIAMQSRRSYSPSVGEVERLLEQRHT